MSTFHARPTHPATEKLTPRLKEPLSAHKSSSDLHSSSSSLRDHRIPSRCGHWYPRREPMRPKAQSSKSFRRRFPLLYYTKLVGLVRQRSVVCEVTAKVKERIPRTTVMCTFHVCSLGKTPRQTKPTGSRRTGDRFIASGRQIDKDGRGVPKIARITPVWSGVFRNKLVSPTSCACAHTR